MWLNYLLIIFIFIVGWYFGLKPLNKSLDTSKNLQKFDYFAKGAFLGLSIMHFLPESIEYAQKINVDIIWVMLLTASFMYVFQFSEQGVFYHKQKSDCKSHNWCSYTIFIILFIHAIIEGSAAGLAKSITTYLLITFCILTHKGAAAFSLCSTLLNSGLSKSRVRILVIAFVAATPLSILSLLLVQEQYHMLQSFNYWILYSIASGTFLYIATESHLQTKKHNCHICRLPFVLYFGLGLGIISLLSVLEHFVL